MTDNTHSGVMLKRLLAPLAEQVDDPSIQEIMINGPDDVWTERRGTLEKVDVLIDANTLRAVINVLGSREKRDVRENTKEAIVDTRLGDYRVAAVVSPTAVRGHAICIRKHGHFKTSLDSYISTVGREAVATDEPEVDLENRPLSLVDWLIWAVRAHKTILVSGATSSGKTTFMNALIEHVQQEERVVAIEEVPELHIRTPNHIKLEINNQVGITARDLVRLSLRFRPDRIIVGELRGAEAFDFMQAMNTGHEGGFASIHANSAKSALARLETLVLVADVGWPLEAIRNEVGSTIDYVIHMRRDKGIRRITEIIEVQGYIQHQQGYQLRYIVGGHH